MTEVKKEVEPVESEVVDEIADAVLEKGYPFSVTVTNENILHKWKILPRERFFVLHRTCLGTNFRISHLLKGIDGNYEGMSYLGAAVQSSIKHTDALISIIAYATINKENINTVKLYLRKKFFRKNLTPQELLHLLNGVIQQMDTKRFFGCSVLAGSLNLLRPREGNTSTSGKQLEA